MSKRREFIQLAAGSIETPKGKVRIEGRLDDIQWLSQQVPITYWKTNSKPPGYDDCEDCDSYGCTMNCSSTYSIPRSKS
ncbi:hypothetical protein CBM2626_A40025 [Cupriavidus taiwanensis]|uniref:hypothetical protein n=1 Tax=Cupriavidus taiwanensis TaxID=164546 RepID=UPI000E16251F|nr:hypothetical protein [Cupriavidus taiwanensis]SOZ99480.1 hypothetical protein CBM2626_A40025 [Cupriavidus taiwanensis]